MCVIFITIVCHECETHAWSVTHEPCSDAHWGRWPMIQIALISQHPCSCLCSSSSCQSCMLYISFGIKSDPTLLSVMPSISCIATRPIISDCVRTFIELYTYTIYLVYGRTDGWRAEGWRRQTDKQIDRLELRKHTHKHETGLQHVAGSQLVSLVIGYI